MKYLLFCIALIAARTASAQQVTLGASAGLSPGQVPHAVADVIAGAEAGTNFLWGVRAAVDLKHFQAGIGYDATKISYGYPLDPGGFFGRFDLRSDISLANPYVFANYKIPVKRAHIYFGVNGGYAILGDRKNTVSYKSIGYTISYTASPSGNGVSWGGQAGFNIGVWKGFSAQAEIGARHIPFSSGYTTLTPGFLQDDLKEVPVNTVVWIFPATVGINYSFGLKR